MTSIIKFEPLSGVYDESPLAYLLQIDEFTFLLDCGWDENFNLNHIKNIKKYIHQIDAVLLSYPDLYHLGALPYLVGKCGLLAPIYATIPVYKMGQMFMYDIYQSRYNNENFDVFSLDDVDTAFDRITQLKFSQTVGLKSKGHGLQITPISAGHMIGGTIWKIVKDGEEEIIYAVDFNHKKERHLNGCQILESLSSRQNIKGIGSSTLSTDKPCSLLITDTINALYEQSRRRDQLWRNPDSGFGSYPLVLLNNVSYNVVAFAQSQIEWMSEKISKSLVINSDGNINSSSSPDFHNSMNQSPFHFKHLLLCHSLSELDKIPDPKVVLASSPALDSGFSRDLFLEWCGNSKNSVILTVRTTPGTLARTLIDDHTGSIKTITLEVKKRVKLEGEELVEYIKKKRYNNHNHLNPIHPWRKQKKRLSTEATEELTSTEIDKKPEEKASKKLSDSDFSTGSDDSELSSTSSSSDDYESLTRDDSNKSFSSKKTKSRQRLPYDTYIKDDVYIDELQITDFKRYRKRLVMFPYVEHKVKWDDYGEPIDPNDFNLFEKMSIADDNTNKVENNDATKKENENNKSPNDVKNFTFSEPTKCISTPRTLNIRASITFIDFEGKSDGESYKKIISQIKPKQLILVHGPEHATMVMADYFKNHPSLGIPKNKIFCPKLNEVLNATLESRIFKVKMKDSLTSTFRFSRYKGIELSKLDSSVVYEQDEHDIEKDGDNRIPCLDAPNPESTENNDGNVKTGTHFIGDIKLTDLKQILISSGLQQVEFIGPVLVCNELIAIRKNEAGKLTFEGPICKDYFKIRDIFYQQFAIL
ncbi:cleavage and polyadenylation specificity factor subunit 2-like isoform X2 [Gordionus sp. m RMFG-2023]|uniref:cleavage and polyadenylation specificity factor subunit 2-like isoform X2 n=1 Tax=Gordionus sp. m RMFG-2023 TaxID=3053472 RepID=UPI0031FD943D